MRTHLLSTLATLLAAAHIFAQGDLLPPGPPAPMMKSLDQIEARTIVNATNTPGDGATQFIISAPGSYYLAGNLAGVVGLDGIRITASDVTLDLNGFALAGVPGSGSGVVTTFVRNLAVRNGTVRDWRFTGVEAGLASNSTFEQIRASNNGTGGADFGIGISVGFGCIISGCVALENSSIGLAVNGAGAVTGCVAQSNGSSGFGDFFPGGSAFAHCAARGYAGTGFGSAGGSTFTGCTAKGNVGNGFSAGSDATLTGCSARRKRGPNSINSACAPMSLPKVPPRAKLHAGKAPRRSFLRVVRE